ncbi:MAG: hypothetical protein ABJE79_08650 [Marinomonas sp.]
MTTAVTLIQSESDYINLNVVKAILAEENRALYFTRSASLFSCDNPKDYSLAYRHIGIYGYRVSMLKRFFTYLESKLEEYEKLEQLRALSYGMSIGAIVATSAPPHGIATKADYEELKQLMVNK